MTHISPYCFVPDYADVKYIDGKLEVAVLCSKHSNPETAAQWKETIDVLLMQRAALMELENGSDR